LVLRGRRRVTLDVIEALAPILGTTAEAVLQREFPDPVSVSSDPFSSATFTFDANVLELIKRILRSMFSEADIKAVDFLTRSLPKPGASAKTPAHSGHRLPKVVDPPTEQARRG